MTKFVIPAFKSTDGCVHSHPSDEIALMKACNKCMIGRYKVKPEDYDLTFEESINIFDSVSDSFKNLKKPEPIRLSNSKNEVSLFNLGLDATEDEILLTMAETDHRAAELFEVNIFLRQNPEYKNDSGIIVLKSVAGLVFPHVVFKKDADGISKRMLTRKMLTSKESLFPKDSIFV